MFQSNRRLEGKVLSQQRRLRPWPKEGSARHPTLAHRSVDFNQGAQGGAELFTFSPHLSKVDLVTLLASACPVFDFVPSFLGGSRS